MKRQLFTGAILLLAGLPACSRGPAHLSRARMAPIVTELQLADVYSGMVRDSLRPNTEKNTDSLARWTIDILHRHGITREEFNSSMDWYRDHPTELDSLFAAVVPILEKAKQ